MSGLNDFLKGIGAFSQGLSQFAQSQAIGDAQEQLRQINNTQMDKKQREQALNELSQGFALRLGQAGASAAEIQSTAGRLGMTEPQQRNLDLSRGMLAGRQEQAKINAIARVEAARQETQGQKNELTSKLLTNAQKEFDKKSTVKKASEALNQAKIAISLLEAGNPVADQAIKTFMARATGEVGNLTEAEREMFAGSPALSRQLSRLKNKYIDGKLSDADREDIKSLAQTMYQANLQNINNEAVKFASGFSRANKRLGLQGEEVLSVIAPQVLELQNRIKASISQLKNKNPNDPRILKLETKLRNMRIK